MTVTIYHNPRCSKSRATLALLEERGASATVVEYLKSPPDADQLRSILAKLGIGPRDLLRAKEAKEAGIDGLDGDALIDAMVTHPVTIERPIVVTATGARIGRPPERVLELL